MDWRARVDVTWFLSPDVGEDFIRADLFIMPEVWNLDRQYWILNKAYWRMDLVFCCSYIVAVLPYRCEFRACSRVLPIGYLVLCHCLADTHAEFMQLRSFSSWLLV